jgi:hypothetical protein
LGDILDGPVVVDGNNLFRRGSEWVAGAGSGGDGKWCLRVTGSEAGDDRDTRGQETETARGWAHAESQEESGGSDNQLNAARAMRSGSAGLLRGVMRHLYPVFGFRNASPDPAAGVVEHLHPR